MAAVFGGTQSLHTNALDEAIALPTDFSARIARNTQLILQEESEICKAIDPWAGSEVVEKLTQEMVEKAWKLILEVEELGGMTAAIESGLPKLRIEEAAARRQARIDSGSDKIIGVNCFQVDEELNSKLELLEVDNKAVRLSQIERLKNLRANRDNAAVQDSLAKLTAAAGSDQNLLEAAIDAASKRASLGEISDAMEKVFGRYALTIRSISGVYSNETGMDQDFAKARALADEVTALMGRRPRILVAKMGQDGHDRGAKVIATAFADIGFDVDIGPLFQTPEEVAKQAVENDVHVAGVSSLAAGHKTLIPELVKELEKLGRKDILIVAGGVIPERDFEYLYDNGCVGVFGPGTKISLAAIDILEILKAGFEN
jgi:methylmalonyl-CoA mutase